MDGFGSHTYSLINAKSERFWVKFHFKTQQGIENLHQREAGAASSAATARRHQRDLFEAIERGEFPKWTVYVQIMPEDRGRARRRYNPFDLTKVWPHGDYPLHRGRRDGAQPQSGELFRRGRAGGVLAGQVVPGIGHSPDKMLQARIFSYADAHRYRVGVNDTRCR